MEQYPARLIKESIVRAQCSSLQMYAHYKKFGTLLNKDSNLPVFRMLLAILYTTYLRRAARGPHLYRRVHSTK